MEKNQTRVINKIWHSNDKDLWNQGILEYYYMIENVKNEQYIENISREPSKVKNMNGDEVFEFLHDHYFEWKYTACNRLANCIKWLDEADKKDYFRGDLKNVINSIFELVEFDPSNYKKIISKAKKIPGIGISGASGLVSILFPDKYATVDQYLVKALNCIEQPEFDYMIIEKMVDKPDDLTISNACDLQLILQKKAKEIGLVPRQIDMVLWAVRDKERLTYQDKQGVDWYWMINS